MSRNACHFYLPIQANRPLPLFRESNSRSRTRRLPELAQDKPALAVNSALAEAQFAVAQTIASTISPTGTTVLLGFDNLVHFLDWLENEPMPVHVAED